MRLIFEKGKWNDKRDTPAAAPPPCRLHFLMFSALHAEKAALLRRKNAFGRTTAFLAPRMPSQNKKPFLTEWLFVLVEISGIEPLTSWLPVAIGSWYGAFLRQIRPFCQRKVQDFAKCCSLRPHAFAHTWVRIWVRAVRRIWRGSVGVDVDYSSIFVDSQVKKEQKSPYA